MRRTWTMIGVSDFPPASMVRRRYLAYRNRSIRAHRTNSRMLDTHLRSVTETWALLSQLSITGQHDSIPRANQA